MKIYKLNRSVISISEVTWDFLNGISSNVREASQNAFLNIHGKIVVTFDQLQIREDAFLILVEKSYEAAVLEHLKKFTMIVPAKVELWKDHHIYYDLDNSLIIDKDDHCLPQEKGKIVITTRNLKSTVSEEEFTLYRLHNNIPLQGVDYKDDFLLNVSVSRHVSFTKGCYLGQEPISKVNSRSKPSRRLIVRRDSQCSPEERSAMTSKARDPETGEMLGFVFVDNK